MSSRRQFLTGLVALGATPLLAQDEPKKEPYILEPSEILPHIDKLKGRWEDERRDDLDRLRALNVLERVLLSRYLAPVDTWLHLKGYMKIPAIRARIDWLMDDHDSEGSIGNNWFLLKIVSADRSNGTDIWMKFSIDNTDRKLVWVDNDTDEAGDGSGQKQVFEPVADTLYRKRDSLMEALEHHLVQLLDESPEDDGFDVPFDTEPYKRTLMDGTAHLYLLFGPDQDPAKVMKEQLLA